MSQSLTALWPIARTVITTRFMPMPLSLVDLGLASLASLAFRSLRPVHPGKRDVSDGVPGRLHDHEYFGTVFVPNCS